MRAALEEIAKGFPWSQTHQRGGSGVECVWTTVEITRAAAEVGVGFKESGFQPGGLCEGGRCEAADASTNNHEVKALTIRLGHRDTHGSKFVGKFNRIGRFRS